jgi:cytochrome P450
MIAVMTQGQGHGGFVVKAQKLIDEVVGRGRLPGYEDRKKLPYIEAIVEEVLRWRPIASAGVPHRNMVQDTYEGHTIPKGSIIVANHWAIGRDASVFGQSPEEFTPERWLLDDTAPADGSARRKAEVEAELKNMPTIGFGYGRRMCPGRHIARSSLWIQIARLLWAFDIEPSGAVPDPMDAVTAIVTMPLPYTAIFKARGPEVTDLVSRNCDTWGEDIVALLNRVGKSRG